MPLNSSFAAINIGKVYQSHHDVSDQFEFFIEPGETQTGAIWLNNSATTNVDIYLYAADQRFTKQQNLTVASRSHQHQEVGTWLQLKKFHDSTITLPANQAISYDFNLTIPSNTPNGIYRGGIVAEGLEQKGTSIRRVLPVTINIGALPNQDSESNPIIDFFEAILLFILRFFA